MNVYILLDWEVDERIIHCGTKVYVCATGIHNFHTISFQHLSLNWHPVLPRIFQCHC